MTTLQAVVLVFALVFSVSAVWFSRWVPKGRRGDWRNFQ